jgi:formate hydrogenlyase transcriptional activator
MPEQRLAFDPAHASGLTVGQYDALLDLVQPAIAQTTINTIFPTLARRVQQALSFNVLTLGLYNFRTQSMDLSVWNGGEVLSEHGSHLVDSCASGWVWKTQRSVLVQDLATEDKLPVFLRAIQQLGIRSYYVLPLTTVRRRIGAVGFGSSQVISDRKEKVELLRRMIALIAPLVEGALAGGLRTDSNCPQIPLPVTVHTEQHLPFDLHKQAIQPEPFHGIVGTSAPFQELLRQVRTVAATDATVLLLGETGTGKELVARAIHLLSPRADRKLISVNCTAIPTELLESELFGHEKGAFTGAMNRRVGRVELADRSTLLLDEVGDLPSLIQPKLLRILQDKEFERLGSNRTIKVDVRLIAATNQDLHQSVAQGRFREDLFYRLNVFPIHVPPLRERKSDIPALVHYFVSRYSSEAKKSIESIPAEAMDALLNWRWPGNIRELQNFVQRCVILTNSTVLTVPGSELRQTTKHSSGPMSQEAEREVILQALAEARGVMGGPSGAAKALGMKRTTLYSRMKKLNISPR